MAQIEAELVTPEGRLLRRSVDMVVVPGEAGSMGVLARHEPAVVRLRIGEVRIHDGGNVERYAVGEGFLRVTEDRALILVEQAERADEIDRARAEESVRTADEVLGGGEPPTGDDDESVAKRREHDRARRLKARAENRLKVAGQD